MNKVQILEDIHRLVSHNVIGDKQLMNRYKGFRGEMFLNQTIGNKPYRELLEGGLIVSTDPSYESSLDHSIYINIVEKYTYTSSYDDIYRLLSPLNFNKMYLIIYDRNILNTSPVMIYPNESVSFDVPEMTIYEYNCTSYIFEPKTDGLNQILNNFNTIPNRKKNTYPISVDTKNWLIDALSPFEENELYQLFMTRLILDGYIGFSKKKGKPSDIDLITKRNGKYSLIEVKEKDVPKRAKKGFGLDTPRIGDFDRISKATGLSYYLIVREIDNQTNRNLLGWKYINITDFIEDVKKDTEVEGGTGMRSAYSDNPTLICSYDKFQDIN